MYRLPVQPIPLSLAPVPAPARAALPRLPRIVGTGYGTSQGYVRLRRETMAPMPSRFRIA